MKKVQLKNKCSLCGSKDVVKVLDLGNMPNANSFLKKRHFSKENSFPLQASFCKKCKSFGLRHAVSSKLLFKNYVYITGASKPLVEHFEKLANEITENFIHDKNDLVLEIGSNDGSLLKNIGKKARILGVDPAKDIAKKATKSGVPTIASFFNSKFSKSIKDKHGPAKVVVANNVMAHVSDLKDVFLGVKNILREDGVFIFEVHWVGNLLTEGGFDQIYHEHFYYHSLHALKNLLTSIGMNVSDVAFVPIHGQSIRVYAGIKKGTSQAVKNLLKREKEMGLISLTTYKKFSKKIKDNKKKLIKIISEIKKQNKRIVGYGAPAKGNTLLNYFEIGNKIIDYITDTTPSKQGLYTPGTHIPVVSPDILIEDTPDYVLLLSWNYAESILEKEKWLREKGVKFIIPVPKVRIV